MKCVWHWKWIVDPYVKDSYYWKVQDKFDKAIVEHPDDFPKLGTGMHTGRGVGFRLIEGTEEQMANLVAIWAPVEEWRLEVYFESSEEDSVFGKAWRRWTPL